MKTPVMMIFDLIKEGKTDSLQFIESVMLDHERRVLDDCFDSSRLAHPSTGFQYACFEDWYNETFKVDSKQFTVNNEGPHYENGEGYGDLDEPTE